MRSAPEFSGGLDHPAAGHADANLDLRRPAVLGARASDELGAPRVQLVVGLRLERRKRLLVVHVQQDHLDGGAPGHLERPAQHGRALRSPVEGHEDAADPVCQAPERGDHHERPVKRRGELERSVTRGATASRGPTGTDNERQRVSADRRRGERCGDRR
jgi:hypothetical protein